ncbi:Fic/DOC family protein [Rhodococcus sp. NPDC060176]|uniref:Fic/DOC family protein n=1 Tax=Rhodococcus sp. NPDC060176 TaxID=3347062 RepID=UPI00364D8461
MQDVYDWAGTLRTRDTGAVGMNLPHCRPEHIENQAAFIFRGIAKDNFPQGLPKDRAVDRLAYHWGETTVLHPFRDGNSRTQRVFFDELLKSSGWTIDWQKVHASAVQAARYVAMEATHTPRPYRSLRRPQTAATEPAETRTRPRQRLTTSS